MDGKGCRTVGLVLVLVALTGPGRRYQVQRTGEATVALQRQRNSQPERYARATTPLGKGRSHREG